MRRSPCSPCRCLRASSAPGTDPVFGCGSGARRPTPTLEQAGQSGSQQGVAGLEIIFWWGRLLCLFSDEAVQKLQAATIATRRVSQTTSRGHCAWVPYRTDTMPHSEPDRPSTKRQKVDAVVKAPSAANKGSAIFAPFRVSRASSRENK